MKKSKVSFKVWLNIAMIVLLLIFVLQNLEPYNVRFFLLAFSLPIFVIVIVSFLIGFYTSFFMKIFKKEKTHTDCPQESQQTED